MDMYCTEDELILIKQAAKRLAEDPSYRLHAEEIQAFICARMRGVLKNMLRFGTPEDTPLESPTCTLDSQPPYIQKMIRRHEMEIRLALARNTEEFLTVLAARRINVSPDVVQCCLAELINEKSIRNLLGYSPDEVSVEQQAEQMGLVMVNPNRQRGQYVGPVVGMDHRSALIEFARGKAVELPLEELTVGQERPEFGRMVRMKFKNGALVVSMAENGVRKPPEAQKSDF